MKPRLRHGDIFSIVGVGLAALLCGVGLWFQRTPAARVAIRYPDDSSVTFSLTDSREIVVEGNHGIVLTVTIAEGRVCVSESTCPDHVCVRSGWLSKNGQVAACVPAGVYVQVVGGNSEVDGVTI